MTTDASGTATTSNDLLPYGSYEIIEKTPPVGYLPTGVLRQSFNITSHGVIVSLKTSATVIKNNVIRGGVEIEKWDIERDGRTLKQGDAITNDKLVGKSFWQKRVVQNILTDQVYIGDMVQGKTRTVNHKEVLVPREEWVCVQNTHDAIISRSDFERVQTLLLEASERDKAARGKAIPYSPHIFKGKMFCAHCGQPMHRHRQNKDGIYWYRCETQWKIAKNACYVVSVKEADIENAVLMLLRKYSEAILGGYIQKERLEPVKEAACENELADINSQLAKSGGFLKSLYENMMAGLITAEEFVSMKADYETKIEALSKRADAIRATKRDRASAFEDYREFSKAAVDALFSREITPEVASQLVEKILVRYDKSFEITLRFRDEFMEVRKVG
jgi:hypothetical protein